VIEGLNCRNTIQLKIQKKKKEMERKQQETIK
jgi:hypothetical protein